jgi:hypothetical protein
MASVQIRPASITNCPEVATFWEQQVTTETMCLFRTWCGSPLIGFLVSQSTRRALAPADAVTAFLRSDRRERAMSASCGSTGRVKGHALALSRRLFSGR